MTTEILVVDDSPLMQSIVRVALRARDCRLKFASNGADALKVIESGEQPGLIVLDVNMPIMDGLEFMEHLREHGLEKRIPVILCSTEGEEHDVARGLEAGARAYLRKPFSPDELGNIIDRVLSL